MTCLARYAYWVQGTMRVAKPLTGLMPILQEKTDALYCKPAQEPVAREVIVPKR